MAIDEFVRFRQTVTGDPARIEDFCRIAEPGELEAKVLAVGRANGFCFSERDLEEIIRINARSGFERAMFQ